MCTAWRKNFLRSISIMFQAVAEAEFQRIERTKKTKMHLKGSDKWEVS